VFSRAERKATTLKIQSYFFCDMTVIEFDLVEMMDKSMMKYVTVSEPEPHDFGQIFYLLSM
jgi:hypothetical protein